MKPTVMLVGLGRLGSVLLELLAREDSMGHIVVGHIVVTSRKALATLVYSNVRNAWQAVSPLRRSGGRTRRRQRPSGSGAAGKRSEGPGEGNPHPPPVQPAADLL